MIANVGPVETGDDEAVLRDSELGQDVGASATVRGRGKRQPRHLGILVQQSLSAAGSRAGNRAPIR